MKKIATFILAMFLCVPVSACTDYLGYEDWCGYQYHQYDAVQPRYCQYCGSEAWACSCGVDYGAYDGTANGTTNGTTNCTYDAGQTWDYTCQYGQSCTAQTMAHWANIRDCSGNIIGTACEGSYVEVVGTDPGDSSRVLVYCDGVYGSVLSSCVYGGYVWDGSYACGSDGGSQDYTGCQDYTGYQDYTGSQGYTDCQEYTGCQDYSGCQDYTDYQSSDCGYSYADGSYCGGNDYQLVGYCEQTMVTVTETTTRSWTYAGQRWCR